MKKQKYLDYFLIFVYLITVIFCVGIDENDEFIGLSDRQIKKVNHYIETFRIDNILYGDRDVLREQMLKKMQKYDQEEDLC